MEKKQYSGKTLEDAINQAKEQLQETAENLIINQLETKQGLFNKKTTIEVIEKREVIDYIKNLLKTITKKMGIEIQLEVKTGNTLAFTIYADDENNALLIGKGGKNIEALSLIMRQAVLNEIGQKFPFVVDVSEYRQKRENDLIRLATREAKNVLKTKVEVKLQDMNSYERRIVHNALTDFKNIITESVGEDPHRAIVIKPREE